MRNEIEAIEMAIEALEQEPCEDVISRQAVLDSINANCVYENEYNLTTKHIKDAIEQLPPITPKAKVGKWIADVDRWGDIVTTVNGYRCSECNTFDTDKDNYCPNCGAKMESEKV
jgi:rubrerythrin